MSRIALAALLVSLAASLTAADFPAPTEGDYVMSEFQFTTGEGMSHLNLHYTTIGAPVKNAAGVVTNAVLIMHGTGEAGAHFSRKPSAGNSSARANCWTRRNTSSFCRTISATGNPASRAMECI